MCGRYASSRDPADLVAEFEIRSGNVNLRDAYVREMGWRRL